MVKTLFWTQPWVEGNAIIDIHVGDRLFNYRVSHRRRSPEHKPRYAVEKVKEYGRRATDWSCPAANRSSSPSNPASAQSRTMLATSRHVMRPIPRTFMSPSRRCGNLRISASRDAAYRSIRATPTVCLTILDASPPDGLVDGTGDLRYGQTMAFTTLMLFQIFNVVNVRSDERSAFVHVFTNGWLWTARGVRWRCSCWSYTCHSSNAPSARQP